MPPPSYQPFGFLSYAKVNSQTIPRELLVNGNFLYLLSLQGTFEYATLIPYLEDLVQKYLTLCALTW
jgi:hypothetical protein